MTNERGHPLGIVLSTVTDAPIAELGELGQIAEQAGFSSVYVNEGRGDAIACCQAIGSVTRRISVGTNIANIYFRHPFLASQSARSVAELSGGRFVLGLGMSHRGLLSTLGIDMGNAREQLAEYVEFVVKALEGNVGAGFLVPPKSPHPVPVYVAANTVESATIAGAVGDGIMPFLSPLSYLPSLVETAREAARKAGRDSEACRCVISIPTFVSDDAEAARSAARYNLAFFAQLPNYRRQWRRAGYVEAMNTVRQLYSDGANRRDVAAQIPDALVDDVCIHGPADACREQLAAFHAAGADEPVIAVSPVNQDRLAATRAALSVL